MKYWIVMICLVGTTFAQDFRATLNGKVTDPAKDVIPGAVVTVTNVGTNETIKVTTNTRGNYSVPFLNPGTYMIMIEAAGFKKYSRSNQVLQVNQSATLDIELELGAPTETVTVTSEAPLLDEANADRGTVIDNTIITELPLNTRNPIMLAAFATGTTFTGSIQNTRSFDNQGISSFAVNGGRSGQNEFLLDGAPNNALRDGSNAVSLVPPLEAVQEFKIISNAYDASYGRTSGGIINISLKSGGNAFHGSAYEFARRSFMDANTSVGNYRGIPRGKYLRTDGTLTDAPLNLDQFGGSFSGPVRIPKVYDGRNRTFFLFTYEYFIQKTPNPAIRSMPTEDLLRGDFSNLRDRNGNQIKIYDPATGKSVTGGVCGKDSKGKDVTCIVRDPFPGNKIPENRIHPLAKQLIPYFAKPNYTSPTGDPWRNNYADIPNQAQDNFSNWAARIDQNISPKDKFYFRVAYNRRREFAPSNGLGETLAASGQLPLIRANHNGVADWVHTFNSSLILNVRASASRYHEVQTAESAIGFNITELGFPQSLSDQLPVKIFPRINISDYTSLGRGSIDIEPTNVFAFQPNIVWLRNSHSIRAGLDMRITQYSRQDTGEVLSISFNRNYTRKIYNRNTDGLEGNTIASLLLGATSGGTINYNAPSTHMWKYYAPWIQDDWKIARRLTLNVGLRWDLNTPVTERYNRINYAFDTLATNPVSSKINKTAFPQYTDLKGGLGFLGVNGSPSTPWKLDKNNIQPRIGAAFSLNDKTVLRGGIGRFYLNPSSRGHRQGFNISTSLISSIDSGATPNTDPLKWFPNGVLLPPGSSKGLETLLGRDISYSDPNFVIPYVDSFSFGFQRQLGWKTVLDLSYVGSRSHKLETDYAGINIPSAELRRLCDASQGGKPEYCTDDLPNPFYKISGFEGSGSFDQKDRDRYLLERPYPHFGRITETQRNEGESWYNSLQVSLNRRVKGNLFFKASYSFSKVMDALPDDYTDAGVFRPAHRVIGENDRPHRFALASIYNMPFGRGRTYLQSLPKILDGFVGGWELALGFIYESGRPWAFPDGASNRDLLTYIGGGAIPDSRRKLVRDGVEFIQGVSPCVERLNRTTGNYELTPNSKQYGCTTAAFRVLETPYQTLNTPLRDSRIRRPSFHAIDINLAKNFKFKESKQFQFRLEAFNLFNTPVYSGSDYNRNYEDAGFGTINRSTTGQSNYPRQLQMALKFIF